MIVDLGGISVCIGMPVYGRIPPHTTLSLARTAQACGAGGVDMTLCIEARGIVTWCRDMVLDSFLQSKAQKLFWIDSDMAWEPEAFFRLLALSTKRDVVCAAYRSKVDEPTYQINGTGVDEPSDELGLIRINGIGLGFSVMDRKVCEAVAAKAAIAHDDINGRDMPAVFRTDIVDGKRVGEDIAFFNDIGALGYQIWLDPTLELGHVGDKMWTGRASDTLRSS